MLVRSVGVALQSRSSWVDCPAAASPDARSGNDYYNELAEDLSEEALAWVESSNDDLIRAPHPPVVKQVEGAPAAEEPLDGELVVVEDD